MATPRIEINGLKPILFALQITVYRAVGIVDFRGNHRQKYRTICRASCPQLAVREAADGENYRIVNGW